MSHSHHIWIQRRPSGANKCSNFSRFNDLKKNFLTTFCTLLCSFPPTWAPPRGVHGGVPDCTVVRGLTAATDATVGIPGGRPSRVNKENVATGKIKIFKQIFYYFDIILNHISTLGRLRRPSTVPSVTVHLSRVTQPPRTTPSTPIGDVQLGPSLVNKIHFHHWRQKKVELPIPRRFQAKKRFKKCPIWASEEPSSLLNDTNAWTPLKAPTKPPKSRRKSSRLGPTVAPWKRCSVDRRSAPWYISRPAASDTYASGIKLRVWLDQELTTLALHNNRSAACIDLRFGI